jgi:hypothetical protein
VAAARWLRRWRQRDIVTSAAAWRWRGGGGSAAARQRDSATARRSLAAVRQRQRQWLQRVWKRKRVSVSYGTSKFDYTFSFYYSI